MLTLGSRIYYKQSVQREMAPLPEPVRRHCGSLLGPSEDDILEEEPRCLAPVKKVVAATLSRMGRDQPVAGGPRAGVKSWEQAGRGW